jgi:hypothetical protein
MKKPESIILTTVLIFAALIGGLWIWKGEKGEKSELYKNKRIQVIQSPKEDRMQDQQEQQNFLVDVDTNLDHWQTKETEFFTIKFPKEWYWLRSEFITNNPNFDINKYAGIGVFSDIGPNSPLMLSNATEAVITDWGRATSDAGTPQDSLDAILKLARNNNPSVDCNVINNRTIPFTAFCTATYDSQLQQSYYVINNKISLTLTARTTKDTLVKKEILDKIAESIILK